MISGNFGETKNTSCQSLKLPGVESGLIKLLKFIALINTLIRIKTDNAGLQSPSYYDAHMTQE